MEVELQVITLGRAGFMNEPAGLFDYTPFPNHLYTLVHPKSHKPLSYYLSPAEEKLLNLVIFLTYGGNGKTSLTEIERYTGLSSRGIRLVREVLVEAQLISVTIEGNTNHWDFHLENIGVALNYYYNKKLLGKVTTDAGTEHLEISRLIAIGCKLWFVKSNVLDDDLGTVREGTFTSKAGEIVKAAKGLRKLNVTLDELHQMTQWFNGHWKNNGTSTLSPSDYLSNLLIFREYQQKLADDTNMAYRQSLLELYEYKGEITTEYEKHITHIASKLIEAKKPLEWVRGFRAIFYSHYPKSFKLPNSKQLIEKHLTLELKQEKKVTTNQTSSLAQRLEQEAQQRRSAFLRQ